MTLSRNLLSSFLFSSPGKGTAVYGSFSFIFELEVGYNEYDIRKKTQEIVNYWIQGVGDDFYYMADWLIYPSGIEPECLLKDIYSIYSLVCIMH